MTSRIRVHHLDHARAACQAAAECGVPVLLETPPHGAVLGPAYLLRMVEIARAEHPAARAELVVDCGDAPGFALAALRLGIKHLRVRAGAAQPALDDLAAQYGAEIDDSAEPVLDLAECPDPLAACRAYLA